MMSESNPTPALLFVLFIFTFTSLKLSYCNSITCPETEKDALLSFKHSLEDPSNLLSSWNSSEVDCCKWEGVLCHNLTGHVDKLRLQSYDSFSIGLSGEMNPSLLNLKHLRYLDLSGNNFEGKIPSFIGSLARLEYLNLSNAGFHGTIPHSVGNLSNLRTLSLQDNYEKLDVDSLEWLSGVSRLERLDMSHVNLSKVDNFVQVINKLPSLVELRLKSCLLNSVAPSLNDIINISSLAILQLSDNEFRSFDALRWIFQLRNLIFLDLSHNYLEGPIPSISNTTKLQHVDISFNNLNSTVPDWLYFCKDLEFVSLRYNFLQGTISNSVANLSSLNTLDLHKNELSGKIPRVIARLCKMQTLDLTMNKLQGELSDTFGNMSECFLEALESLCLSVNRLSGHMTDQFGEFKNLQILDLGKNLLSGTIPINLGKLSSLRELRLEVNKFTGNLPESIGQLFNLEVLSINDNMLQGVVTETHFASLTKLSHFSASGNHLTLKVDPNWVPPFKLILMRLGSWNLGVIPSWLETQKKSITKLDLSYNGISSVVPSWFWDIPHLNLSHNQFHGEIPDITTGSGDDWRSMYLSSNKFNGSLPRVAHTVAELDLSNNSLSGGMSHFLCDTTNETYGLVILRLARNKLTGELPDCWMRWPSLRVINIGNNNISGSIPSSFGLLTDLLSLDLYNNKFSGQIPSSIHNCTKLMKIDLSSNEFDGNLPAEIGTRIVNLRILILRANKLSGKISADICHLNSLQILDLSDNNFFGTIPRCVYNFTGTVTKKTLADYETEKVCYFNSPYGLQFFAESAYVSTKGNEYKYDTILSLVTNINLSDNELSGDIPEGLTRLVELGSLNLSGNHLTGLIPDGIGEMKQLESLDLSRNFLYGEIPNGIAILSSLNYLNLSYNNLTGRIPQSTQLMGMNASGFIGNELCGLPLPSDCSDDAVVPGPMYKEEDGGGESKVDWFYLFLSLGYAVGLSVVCGTLIIKKSWREAYFEFLEDMWDKVYVYVCVKWTKLVARWGRRNS
ncbi:hypothetical protein BUALT_Bualt13G0042200 [Buddleja alternifolia]|uniref:Uncharacterized protein n=1 Tax=Buddleja alternifolia TaxID=168488 RepID=A0AAV6WIR5_9LAMI|nr:hypothetical protein BUALT_Bualt13G0042200 [Buddleja alternifolia]